MRLGRVEFRPHSYRTRQRRLPVFRIWIEAADAYHRSAILSLMGFRARYDSYESSGFLSVSERFGNPGGGRRGQSAILVEISHARVWMQRFCTQLNIHSARHTVTSVFHGSSGGFVLDFHAATTPWATRVVAMLLLVRAGPEEDEGARPIVTSAWVAVGSDGNTVEALLPTLCRDEDELELRALRVYRAYHDVGTAPSREVPRGVAALSDEDRRKSIVLTVEDQQDETAARGDGELALAFEDHANRRLYLLVA